MREQIYVEVSGKRWHQLYCYGGRADNVGVTSFIIWSKYLQINHFRSKRCGKSTPYRSLVGNNTKNLVDDIDKIRDFLKIKSL